MPTVIFGRKQHWLILSKTSDYLFMYTNVGTPIWKKIIINFYWTIKKFQNNCLLSRWNHLRQVYSATWGLHEWWESLRTCADRTFRTLSRPPSWLATILADKVFLRESHAFLLVRTHTRVCIFIAAFQDLAINYGHHFQGLFKYWKLFRSLQWFI